MAISGLQNVTFLLKKTATVFVHTLDGNCSVFLCICSNSSSETLFGFFFEIDQHNNKTFNAICCSKNHMTDSCGLPSFL